MDTKYFHEAMEEAFSNGMLFSRKVGDLTVAEFSHLLRRAQELKDADRKSAVLDRMGA